MDNASVALTVIGYQFPDAGGLDYYDANWLVVEGRVVAANGRTWSFRDPCLLVPEAHELADWLRTAASGRFRHYRKRDGAALGFLEPNLGFALRRRTVGE